MFSTLAYPVIGQVDSIPIVAVLMFLVLAITLVMAVVGFLARVTPETRTRFYFVAGAMLITVIFMFAASFVSVSVDHRAVEEEDRVRVLRGGVATGSSSEVLPVEATYSAPEQVVHTDMLSFTWAKMSVMVGVAIVAVLIVQLLLRKAEAWVFWRSSWIPSGALASVAVMAGTGGAFIWQWPSPHQAEFETELPTLVDYLDQRFGKGRGNGGYKNLVQMARGEELEDGEAKLTECRLIGGLPYGVPAGQNSFYSDHYVFTAGRTSVDLGDGAWAPLLANQERYHVSHVTDQNQEVFDIGDVPVSHEPADPIPDTAKVAIGEPVSVTLSAVASGRFTTVAEAWTDMIGRLESRIHSERSDVSDLEAETLVNRALQGAVTRLAVSRQPLIIENEIDGDLVQPMYRVHVAIAEAAWIDATSAMLPAANRERAILLLGGLVVLTLVFGGIASAKTSHASV